MRKMLRLVVRLGICSLSILNAQEPLTEVFQASNINAPLHDSSLELNVLSAGLNEAMEMSISEDGRIFIAERKGKVKLYDPNQPHQTKVITDLQSDTRCESGLIGLALDPKFKENSWIYLYHTINIDDDEYHEHHLSRFYFDGDKIDRQSEKVMLKVKASFKKRIHEAGSIAFGPDGLLYLSVGDNQIRSEYLFSCKTSSNSNDLRGKILRIRPMPDGSYEIPEGNLFKPGTPQTKPEIYVMGCRNPFRISVDSKTGWLLWGENGPPNHWSGLTKIDKALLPAGYDEFNIAKEAGFHGYPMIIANQQEFMNYDFEKEQIKNKFSANQPINDHPENTGLKLLPASKPPLIWYQGESKEFPGLESGGESAIAGPIYRDSKEYDMKLKLPAKYLNTWLIAEWSRGWVKAVHLDEKGQYKGIEPILPKLKFGKPINLKIGPKGRLYVLYYTKDDFGHLVRVENRGMTPTSQPTIAFYETESLPKSVKRSDPGFQLMSKSDCFACHKWTQKSIAPAYKKIAEKYLFNPSQVDALVEKVKLGGSGVWGQIPMPPHPQHSEDELKKMVSTILKVVKRKK